MLLSQFLFFYFHVISFSMLWMCNSVSTGHCWDCAFSGAARGMHTDDTEPHLCECVWWLPVCVMVTCNASGLHWGEMTLLSLTRSGHWTEGKRCAVLTTLTSLFLLTEVKLPPTNYCKPVSTCSKEFPLLMLFNPGERCMFWWCSARRVSQLAADDLKKFSPYSLTVYSFTIKHLCCLPQVPT